MKRERGLSTLVFVGSFRAKPVTATAGREVVQWPVEPVATEEPVERGLRAQRVLRITGNRERGELR